MYNNKVYSKYNHIDFSYSQLSDIPYENLFVILENEVDRNIERILIIEDIICILYPNIVSDL